MPSDAHAHPYDLFRLDPRSETERLSLGVSCAASSWNEAEFLFQEKLSREAAETGGPVMALCFGAHPQLARENAEAARNAVALLHGFAGTGRISAVGEIGFDYFDEEYRNTSAEQETLFREQLDEARKHSLPCVLHLRRAMHKAFEYARELAALPAVVFHSYSGTAREAADIVKRGVNAFFSFGSPVFLNHKRAMEACVLVPSGRLLVETDAPYQPPRGAAFSSWKDLHRVISAVAVLREASGADCATVDEVVAATDGNFRRVYGIG